MNIENIKKRIENSNEQRATSGFTSTSEKRNGRFFTFRSSAVEAKTRSGFTSTSEKRNGRFFTFRSSAVEANTRSGFTLIEMLVAIALFSVVVTVALGTIVTIIDSNRKAQSLTLVINDLNFALESITRTVKTADPSTITVSSDGSTLTVADVIYKIEGSTLKKNNVSIISPSIVIDHDPEDDDVVSGFNIFDSGSNDQPRIFLIIEGEAQISPKISSDFSIQTTISPRKLDILDI